MDQRRANRSLAGDKVFEPVPVEIDSREAVFIKFLERRVGRRNQNSAPAPMLRLPAAPKLYPRRKGDRAVRANSRASWSTCGFISTHYLPAVRATAAMASRRCLNRLVCMA